MSGAEQTPIPRPLDDLRAIVEEVEGLDGIEFTDWRQEMELVYTSYRLLELMRADYIPEWLQTNLSRLDGRLPIDVILGDDERAKEELQGVISGLESPGAS